jgi:hypothetical protein
MYQPVTFDANATYFDDRSTIFSTTIVQSGVAYTFDYLPSATDTVTDPGKFVFGQQLYNNKTNERWHLWALTPTQGGSLV